MNRVTQLMRTRLLILAAISFLPLNKGLAKLSAIDWQPWSDDVFARAKQAHRFVLLDLGTSWCHWCHVMERITYEDPKVIDLIRARYLAVRADADARPDLANRYEDYFSLNDEARRKRGIPQIDTHIYARENGWTIHALATLSATLTARPQVDENVSVAQALFKTALRQPVIYKRVEWWDPREGSLPNPDVQYPELPVAAAFVCAGRSCSAPFRSPDALGRALDQMPH